MSILAVLFLFIVAAVSAANVLSKVNYSFIKPNDKSFVYVNSITHLTVSVDVSTFDEGSTLALSFFTDAEASLSVSASSACVASDNTVVFDETLNATSTITYAKSCTFKADITPSSVGQVFTKLGMDFASASSVASFTTANSTFNGTWRYRLVKAGDKVRLSVQSAIPFAKDDTFTITAGNGAPYAAATTCVSGAESLFLVSARGDRLLFSATRPITSEFACTLDVTAAPTTIELSSSTFMAPSHGITSSMASFVTPLDKPGYNIRVGLINHGVFPQRIVASDNFLYLAIPTSAVSAGDTIKMHTSVFNGIAFSVCSYKNGGNAGAVKTINEYQSITNSQDAHIITLESPLTVNADNYVELLCAITVLNTDSLNLDVSVVSVRDGFFAASPFLTGYNYIFSSNLLSTGVYSSFVSFHEKLNVFHLGGYTTTGNGYNYLYVDVSLRGTDFADLAQVQSKCVITGYSGSPKTLPESSISISGDGVRIKLDSKVVQSTGYRLNVACTDVPVTVGRIVSVYDHVLNKVVSEATIRPNKVKLTFGALDQTQYMSADGVYGSSLPFTLEVQGLYTRTDTAQDNEAYIEFYVFDNNIEILSGVACTTETTIQAWKKSDPYMHSGAVHTVLRVYTSKNHLAECTGFARISPISNGDSSKNFLNVFTSL